MIKSMTGFGAKTAKLAEVGNVSVEIRSTNHKFLEIVTHLPEGFLSLEDRIKKEIESRTKRGRVVCALNLSGGRQEKVFINEPLLAKYAGELERIQKKYHLKNGIGLDALIRLPGVLSLESNTIDKNVIWPRINGLIRAALEELSAMRRKEGAALEAFFRASLKEIKSNLERIKTQFKKVVQVEVEALPSDEERNSFLKSSDITEEIERISFHIKNLGHKLSGSGAVGKELDFIAQEMQREANTMAAKSFDPGISAKVVQMKSQIEKIREQVQNIE